MQIGRRFGLRDQPADGVFCGEHGLFVGKIPLLERRENGGWQPRPPSELNRDLGERYGVPIAVNEKLNSLLAIAQALNRGDVLHAQIATLHKQIPDPPALAKSIEATIDIVDLSRRLKESRLLKADWDPTKHPRWPAGSPGGVGGEFAPSTTTAGNSRTDEPALSPIAADDDNLLLIPAQVTIPFELPGETPFPSEVLPPPALPPNVSPLTIPRNPYPGRPKCVKEWAEATEDCLDLWANGLFGNDRYRGMGRTIAECIMGRVSQDCGGNRWDA